MTGRKTASTINDAELDQLYDQLAALRAVARGYCPACGRGDAAPTVADWEQQKQRGDQVEELLQIAHDTSNKSEAARAEAVQRAERAEDALAYVSEWCDLVDREQRPITTGDVREWLKGDRCARQRAADATGQPSHCYLSTGCLHGRHDYCQSHTGLSGAKKPKTCKWCPAVCICPCHSDGEPR